MQRRLPGDIEVLVVGAGIAGIYAAWRLRQAQVPCIVLEATAQSGGRIQSRREARSHLGLMLDEGANLINSTDTLAIRLMGRFGISYVRRLRDGAPSMHYLCNGALLSQEQFDTLLLADSGEAIARMVGDQAEWAADAARHSNPLYISESIGAYLVRVGAGQLLQRMLWSFFWSEYGQGLEDLNRHVLHDYLELHPAPPAFHLIPHADEAFTVPGGMEQIVDGMLADVGASLLLSHAVASLQDDGKRVQAMVKTPAGLQRITARHVFFAAPLHALKGMDVSIDGITPQELLEARAASYGRGSKLHLKFRAGFRKAYGVSGILLTDTGEQVWVSSTGQGEAGLLTVLTGPIDSDSAAAAKAKSVLKSLDAIAPGLAALFEGFEKTDAPMSYSGSLRPGEKALLTIHEGGPRLSMIGEASGGELQGYLEGALRSAEAEVTRYLIRRAATTQGRQEGLEPVQPA